MFIRNVWYIAGHSEELPPGGILGRTIAGERIVFCRRADGSVYALDDRCPHRRAPLSLGEMVGGGNLRCPYHGITFAGDGRCVHVPGQDGFPADWRIRSYPVLELNRYLWVWPGDPALCGNRRSIPAFLDLGEPPEAESRSGLLPVAGDYRLLVDNLLDPTHAEFVHRTSFGSSDWQAAREAGEAPQKRTGQFTVDMRDDGIDFTFRLANIIGGPCFGRAYAMRMGRDHWDGGIDIRMEVMWQPPGLFLYGTFVNSAGAGPESELGLINLHLLTPETETSTHYFYRCAVRNTNGNPWLADFWREVDERAFREDQRIIEAQQKIIGARDLFEESLWSVQGDQMSIRGRRILKAMLAREATG